MSRIGTYFICFDNQKFPRVEVKCDTQQGTNSNKQYRKMVYLEKELAN